MVTEDQSQLSIVSSEPIMGQDHWPLAPTAVSAGAGGWGRLFWFRCYPVILATSDSHFKLEHLLLNSHYGRSCWARRVGYCRKCHQFTFLANSFWMHFWHSFISTSLNSWHQFEEKLFFCEIKPALQITCRDKIRNENKMKARITMFPPSVVSDTSSLLSANMRRVWKTASAASSNGKMPDYLDVLSSREGGIHLPIGVVNIPCPCNVLDWGFRGRGQ